MTDTTAPLNTYQLLDALREHYIRPGFTRTGAVFLTEVTALNRRNRADAIHVGLWASRGYTVDVHELKVSRSDFQRELDKPAKAEAWWPHSNTFWIVAPNTTVAPPELLPPGWGLMVPGKSRRFRQVVKAEYRELQPSTALLAALLTSMETDQANELQRQRDRLHSEHRSELQQARFKAAADGMPRVREQLERIGRLEELIGFRLSDFDGMDSVSTKTLGEAIRAVVVEKKETRDLDYVLKRLADDAADLAKSAARARKNLAELAPQVALLPAGAVV